MLTHEWLVEDGNLFVIVIGVLFIVIVAGTAWQMLRMKMCNILNVPETSKGYNPYYGSDDLRYALAELAEVAKKTACIEERSEVSASHETIMQSRDVFSAIVNVLNRSGCTMTVTDPEGKTLLKVGDNFRRH